MEYKKGKEIKNYEEYKKAFQPLWIIWINGEEEIGKLKIKNETDFFVWVNSGTRIFEVSFI
jgi:hypothetical protein